MGGLWRSLRRPGGASSAAPPAAGSGGMPHPRGGGGGGGGGSSQPCPAWGPRCRPAPQPGSDALFFPSPQVPGAWLPAAAPCFSRRTAASGRDQVSFRRLRCAVLQSNPVTTYPTQTLARQPGEAQPGVRWAQQVQPWLGVAAEGTPLVVAWST